MWAPAVTAELLELVVGLCHFQSRAVEALIGVEIWLVGGKKQASMEVVGAALGSDLYLCAAEGSILGVLAVGEAFYAVYRFFRRRDDCRPAPNSAAGADAVNRNAVVFILLTDRQSLWTVFCLENTLIAAGRTGPLCTGNIYSITAPTLRAIPNDTRAHLIRLEHAAPAGRQSSIPLA